MEDDLYGRGPQLKRTSMEDDHNRSLTVTRCLASQFLLSLAQLSPSLFSKIDMLRIVFRNEHTLRRILLFQIIEQSTILFTDLGQLIESFLNFPVMLCKTCTFIIANPLKNVPYCNAHALDNLC